MKRQNVNNNKRWLLPVICLAALLLVAGIAAMLLLPGQDAEPEANTGFDGKLYWNVERETYKTGTYTHRSVGEDLYRLLFSVDGEQVQLDVKGMELVRYIDTMDLMGLEFDENGIVVDAKAVAECTGGYAAFDYYVESVDGNTVTANSNYVFKGYSKTLEITENTGIYNVGETGPLCGIPGAVSYNDQIIAVEDHEGNVTHIFTKPYKKPGDIYWNVNKLYDSVNKISTRQPNELMQYEIDFVVNGEAVTLRCRDLDVVNKIDGARIMGLEFDENGYIVEMKTVRQAANGGRSAATNYYVSDLDYKGGQIQIRNKAVIGEADTVASFFPAEDMVVYDMTGNDGTRGKETQLQLNDRVIFILDSRSRITQVFVVSRTEGLSLYWNVDRDWNKDKLTTNRKPDKDGWYYFKMAVNGQHVTVKTNDLSIANAIEKPVNVGLVLDGDVVVEVLAANRVHAGGTYASYLYVKEIKPDGTIVTERTTDGVTTTKIAKVADNCEFYNVSMTSIMEGEKISLSDIKVGDTVHGYKDVNGDISILYVVGSVSDSPMYWNVDKTEYWDSKNKVSTRTPDASGYYNIVFAVNGEQVTLRTRDKEMVNDIDNRTCMGLKLSGSTITKVFGAVQTVNTKGGLFASSYHVTAINGNTITATKLSGTDEGKTVKATMAWNCQVYDVSSTAKLVGEVSSVQVGDQIRGLLNENDQISVLYVLTSGNHAENHKCDCCGKTPLWLAWDGNTTITKSGHYVLNADITAARGISWDEDLNVTLCLNGHKLTAENRRVFGNVTGTLNIVDCVGTGSVHGTTNNNASITMVYGGTLNIYGGTYTAEEITEVKNGGLFTMINGELNIYGGTITGGKTNGYGGNINVSSGTLTLNGGVISNGTSAEGQYGGNIALTGENAVMIMNGGTVSGGTSGSYGGNIAVTKKGARLEINGGVIENGTATTHGGNITVALGTMTVTGGTINGGTATNYGSSVSAVNDSVISIADATITGGQMRMSNTGGLTLGGKVTISDLHLYNIMLSISQDKPLVDAKITLSMPRPGVFAEQVNTDLSGCFVPLDANLAVYYADQQLMLDDKVQHRHCDCGGVGEHTCDETIRWTAYFADMTLEDGGHYYLTDNILDNIAIADNATVHLCLNGYTLSSNARVLGNINAGKTLNIHDCGTIGKVHGMANNNASAAMVNGGTLNIYGGTFTANPITEANKNGGILMAMNEGIINLYNGTVTGGITTGVGGCVYLTNNASFNMYGGTISDGSSASNGGTVAIAGAAKFTMVGGSITGGTAAGKGSCVYYSSTASVVLGGSIVIDDLYIDTDAALTVSETVALDTNDTDGAKASIGVTKTVAGVVATGITQEQAACFTNNGKGKLTFSGDQLALVLPHAHCWCIGAETAPLEHTCDENVEWTAINSDETINMTDGGHYFLNWKGSNVAKSMKVADNATAYLCLNGSVIRAQTLVTLGKDSHLIICDCSADQSGALESSKNSPIQISAGQQVTLLSGTISGTNHYNGNAVKNAASVSMSGGTFYMYGGKLLEGYNASGNGGNVSMSGASQFYMYGGLITGGEAGKKGGNVALINAAARFYMYGGKLTNGTAGTFGGNVSLNNGSQFLMDGANALIADGTSTSTNAAQGGGNIHIHHANGKFTLVNGSVTGGTAANNGGSVFVENGLLEVLGGSIGAGTASGVGNTVYVATNGTVTVDESAFVADIYDVDAIAE